MQKIFWKGGENTYFQNFGVPFTQRVHPYGSKNIFPQLFNLKPLWAQNISKISNSITLHKVLISIYHVLKFDFSKTLRVNFCLTQEKAVSNSNIAAKAQVFFICGNFTGCVSATCTPSTKQVCSKGGASSTYAPCRYNFIMSLNFNSKLPSLTFHNTFGKFKTCNKNTIQCCFCL